MKYEFPVFILGHQVSCAVHSPIVRIPRVWIRRKRFMVFQRKIQIPAADLSSSEKKFADFTWPDFPSLLICDHPVKSRNNDSGRIAFLFLCYPVNRDYRAAFCRSVNVSNPIRSRFQIMSWFTADDQHAQRTFLIQCSILLCHMRWKERDGDSVFFIIGCDLRNGTPDLFRNQVQGCPCQQGGC